MEKRGCFRLTRWRTALAWDIKYTEDAAEDLKKIGAPNKARVEKYMREVAELENPRIRGRALLGNLSGFWRYRVGKFRVICAVRDGSLVIVVVTVGKRESVYG